VGYPFLLLAHILAGMAWVGGALALQAALLVARRSGDPAEVDRVMRSLAWADTWLAIPAPVLVLATGLAMVALSGAWTFTQAWILGSIGLVVVYELVAMVVGARLYRRIAQARKAGEVGGAAHARTMTAWGRLGALLLTILLVVVGLMVFKPGAG
jgi:uncharacterized membrane protein